MSQICNRRLYLVSAYFDQVKRFDEYEDITIYLYVADNVKRTQA